MCLKSPSLCHSSVTYRVNDREEQVRDVLEFVKGIFKHHFTKALQSGHLVSGVFFSTLFKYGVDDLNKKTKELFSDAVDNQEMQNTQ